MNVQQNALDVVEEHYGDDAPEWVLALAEECVRTSNGKTAKLLGYSAGLISNVLRNKYKASTASIEQAIRGVLMKETITCPVIGELDKAKCLRWRKLAKLNNPANSLHIRMNRACRSCANNQENEQ